MIGGRRALVNELVIIINRIDRLGRNDPMKVTEEQTLVTVLLRERHRSAVPLGEGAFALLGAPGGPMAPLLSRAHQGHLGTPVTVHPHPL